MNDYFSSVGDKLSNKIPDKENSLLKGDYDINPTATRFAFSPIQPQELIKAVNTFTTLHGSGLDGICSFLRKARMPILAQSRSQLFNLSLSLGLFPDSWKIARVATGSVTRGNFFCNLSRNATATQVAKRLPSVTCTFYAMQRSRC